jgi:hypothetical protein
VQLEPWTLVAQHEDVASGKGDRRPDFQAALARCRQIGAVLVAARLDRITRRAHTLSQLLEEGVAIRAADMPGADVLMLRIYAAMAQKERELISGALGQRWRLPRRVGPCWAAIEAGDQYRGLTPGGQPWPGRNRRSEWPTVGAGGGTAPRRGSDEPGSRRQGCRSLDVI